MVNEVRLINANDALEKVCENCCCDFEECKRMGFCVDYENINRLPTIDAAPVVRCKDCKHWKHMEGGLGDCSNPRFHLPGHADPTMEADGFCSCGERKDNAHK